MTYHKIICHNVSRTHSLSVEVSLYRGRVLISNALYLPQTARCCGKQTLPLQASSHWELKEIFLA
jgi:hypothetical protein